MYSFSKLSTIENCPYEAYLTYKQHNRGAASVYGILGGCIHDKLEEIMNGEAEESDLRKALESDLEQLELLGLSFPKDYKGGDSIKDNWVADMSHFVDNFEKPEGKFETEEFLLYKIDDDHYIQGYADLVRIDSDDGAEQSIFDWKTSSMYNKEDFLHHGRQLVIYALAKEQAGIKINEVAWIFLKYVDVTFMGKKRANSKTKTEMTKTINRRKIVYELERYIRDDLIDAGYDEFDIEMIMIDALEKNSLDPLPEEVRSNYTIKQCVVNYELTDEIKNECREYINKMINMFESLGPRESDWKPREFMKENKYGTMKEDIFFCTYLCGQRYDCKHLADFFEQKKALEQEIEAFL